jgi:negative regulator of flagellin synthesis FlgM
VPEVAVNLNGIDLGGTAASSTTASSTHKASATQSTPTTPTEDATQQPQSNVSITSTASLLAHLQRSLATRPAVDQSRVDAVSKAISSGTYQIDPDKIAHGLIDSERALGKLP